MTTKHLTPFILGAVVGSVFFSILVSAWTAPSGTPPANNASTPFNLGPAAQVKNGNIGVNGLAVFGNTAMQGNLVLTQGNLTATTPNVNTSAIVATGPSSGFAGYAVSASAGSYNASLARADGYSFVGTGQLYNVGLIHSTSGGIQFPDNTIQTTAAGGGGASDTGTIPPQAWTTINAPFSNITIHAGTGYRDGGESDLQSFNLSIIHTGNTWKYADEGVQTWGPISETGALTVGVQTCTTTNNPQVCMFPYASGAIAIYTQATAGNAVMQAAAMYTVYK